MRVTWNAGLEAALHTKIKRFLSKRDQGRVMGVIRESFGVQPSQDDTDEKTVLDAIIDVMREELPDKSDAELLTIVLNIQRKLR